MSNRLEKLNTQLTSYHERLLNQMDKSIQKDPYTTQRIATKMKVSVFMTGAGILMLVSGAILYGVCKDPSRYGCNETTKEIGKWMIFVSGPLTAVSCCLTTLFIYALRLVKSRLVEEKQAILV